jgi:peptidoglycan/LPS O-acetylase OafA/YrhL
LQYDFLDGLRGYGALSVYLQHFIYEMYPYFLYGRPEKGSKAEEDFHEPPVWL